MSATRRQSEAIDRHNAAVMGLVAERDLLLAQQGELVRVLTLLAAGAISLSDCLHWEELNGFALDPKTDAAWAVTSEGIEQARALLTKLGKS